MDHAIHDDVVARTKRDGRHRVATSLSDPSHTCDWHSADRTVTSPSHVTIVLSLRHKHKARTAKRRRRRRAHTRSTAHPWAPPQALYGSAPSTSPLRHPLTPQRHHALTPHTHPSRTRAGGRATTRVMDHAIHDDVVARTKRDGRHRVATSLSDPSHTCDWHSADRTVTSPSHVTIVLSLRHKHKARTAKRRRRRRAHTRSTAHPTRTPADRGGPRPTRARHRLPALAMLLYHAHAHVMHPR